MHNISKVLTNKLVLVPPSFHDVKVRPSLRPICKHLIISLLNAFILLHHLSI
eukprot:c38775_g1_i1 orf=3-158(+)